MLTLFISKVKRIVMSAKHNGNRKDGRPKDGVGGAVFRTGRKFLRFKMGEEKEYPFF